MASPTSISTPGATSASKSDKGLLGNELNANFRLELFHLGHLYKRPVVVNVLREGIPAPIPYAANLFDYGRTKVDDNLPINLGFAGFRLRFPVNAPHVWDEVVAFLGASYFRFLGRGQRYGLSARGLAVGGGLRLNEEFPYFREFWIETPDPAAERIVIYALLDGKSATGAFRFDLVPGQQTYIETSVTLFARKAVPALGLAPLSSMYFVGKNDRRRADDFRGELHDSDGLLMHTGAGEWIWRPLENPVAPSVSAFLDANPRGYGLLQRDRDFTSCRSVRLQNMDPHLLFAQVGEQLGGFRAFPRGRRRLAPPAPSAGADVRARQHWPAAAAFSRRGSSLAAFG